MFVKLSLFGSKEANGILLQLYSLGKSSANICIKASLEQKKDNTGLDRVLKKVIYMRHI